MPSEQEPTAPSVTVFKPMIFASLIVVGLIITLACVLKILDSLSWLSGEFHAYRARRAVSNALAQNIESFVMENRVVEDGVIEKPLID